MSKRISEELGVRENPYVDDERLINYIFKGSRWFAIDNFYPLEHGVMFEGLLYRNSEAAFQSAKTLDIEVRKKFTHMEAAESKQYGKNPRLMKLRDDWDKVRYDIMYEIVRDKMLRNPKCLATLLDTGEAEIVEGTWWNDRIWGVDLTAGNRATGWPGMNYLGKILVDIREKAKRGEL